MVKKLSLVLMALLLIVLSACSSSSSSSDKKKTIVLGTSADYPPFESVDTTNGNKIIGFDLDLAKYLANQMGYKLVIKNQDFNGLIAALNSKKVDFVMAGMVDTADREKQVDFSKTYFNDYQVILTKNAGIKSVEDLKGKKVGVQLGTTQETLAVKLNKTIPMNIQRWDKLNEMAEAMKAGKLDAIITVSSVAYGFTSKDKSLHQFKALVNGKPESDPVSAAFPKGSKIKAQFDKALAKAKKNGKLDELVNKWIKNQ
ncbi:transporter substrate-binding domain-containing protein [Sporolactobacillus laevolacticus]|uniref:transporter substrate-binding domain-containing protein n=1 Tax=Sporolactobacillus laevolacticus TaxID=33018 RepID=UPI0025B3D1C5|nr:transporter substrate-binding domain-containing protein [Sporolactobacillus laevolacticus]MDN3955333.1 transporter substrate-binding domain-containing protein [Sporolactobacillus laevolacticus]